MEDALGSHICLASTLTTEYGKTNSDNAPANDQAGNGKGRARLFLLFHPTIMRLTFFLGDLNENAKEAIHSKLRTRFEDGVYDDAAELGVNAEELLEEQIHHHLTTHDFGFQVEV